MTAPVPQGEDTDLGFSRLPLFDAQPVSPEIIARTRKNTAIVLQRLNEIGGGNLAQRVGVHDSAVSRWKGQGAMAFMCRLLACMDLKIVPADAIVYTQPDEFK